MMVSKIEVWGIYSPFRKGSYSNSHVTQAAVHGRMLRIQMVDGSQGLGEIVFPLSLSADGRQQLTANEPNYLSSLVGKDADSMAHLAAKLRSRGKAWSGIAFGVETAWYDWLGRSKGLPIWQFIGGRATDSVDDYFSISECNVGDIGERLNSSGPNRRVIQLKLGIGRSEDDARKVRFVLNRMTNQQTLLADANGVWSVDRAYELISQLDDPRVIWEEPCSKYEENVEVARLTNKFIMVDQCVGEIELAKRAIDDGVVSALCIKPSYLGGLKVASDLRDYCVSRGMKMRIDGPWCGDIATAAILHLAVGTPPNLLIASCDLREPLIHEVDLKGVIRFSNCRIGPPSGPGLGITLLDNELGKPEGIYSIT